MSHVHNIISNFCIHYSLLTRKSFISSADPVYPSWLPLTPSALVISTVFFVEYKQQNQMNKNKPISTPIPLHRGDVTLETDPVCPHTSKGPDLSRWKTPAHSLKFFTNLAADSTTSLLTSACVMKRKTSQFTIAISAGKRDKKMLLQKVSFLNTQCA